MLSPMYNESYLYHGNNELEKQLESNLNSKTKLMNANRLFIYIK